MYRYKYLKYKNKYLQLMNQKGGNTKCNSPIQHNDTNYLLNCNHTLPIEKSVDNLNSNIDCDCNTENNIEWNCICNTDLYYELYNLIKKVYNHNIPHDFKIEKAYGEESPIRLLVILKILFGENFKYFPINKKPSNYKIKSNSYEFIYMISDPSDENKTSPDFYLQTNQKYNYFIEDTGCKINDSGNNAQNQRATKFIPKIFENKDKLFYILSDNNIIDFKNPKSRAKLEYPFKQWRTSNVNLIFENITTMKNYISLDPYTDYNQLIEHHDQVARITEGIFNYDISNNTICLHLNIKGSKYNLIKSNNGLTHDPGIGSLALLLQTIYNIHLKNKLKLPKIILQNIAHKQSDIKITSTGNKIFRLLKYIIENDFNIEFIFTEEYSHIVFNIHNFKGYKMGINPFKNTASMSEKIISMYHESNMIKNNNIIFVNHARSENTKVYYKNNILDFPKNAENCILGGKCTEGKKEEKPDIIILNNQTNKVEIIEAELFENIEKGQTQINTWSSNEYLYRYYIEKVKITEDIDIYLELYDRKNKFNGDFSNKKYKNVKYILNAEGVWYENKDNYEPLKFKSF